MAIAMATGHLGPKFFSQVKANYICSNIGLMGTLAATSQLSVSGNQGAQEANQSRYPHLSPTLFGLLDPTRSFTISRV